MERPPKQNRAEMSTGEAVKEIYGLMHEELQRGGIDIERDQFQNIIELLEQGEINSQEALAQALKITEGRQDYH